MAALAEHQQRFTYLLGTMILHAYHDLGLTLSLGECWRPREVAALYQQRGCGVADSLHTDRLAIDVNVFEQGVYETDADAYRALGEWWREQDPACQWGGRFGDFNHFSFSAGDGRQ